MLNYSTYLSPRQAVPDQDVARANAAFASPSPWGAYGAAHKDIMRASGRGNEALYNLAASKANADFSLQEQQARNQLALAGLQQMGQQQNYQQNLANSRLSAVNGIFNSLLGGLYQ